MKVVIALGGNAITPGSDTLDPDALGERVRAAASAIADIARGHDVVVTHGNGPQVGLLALRAQALAGGHPGEPLDALGAETEGLIGYLIERELASIFPGSEVATLLTQVEVSADDPAFRNPEQADRATPLGRAGTRPRAAHRLAVRPAGGRLPARGAHRPSPCASASSRPSSCCVEAGVLVVCAGGGGIPVLADRRRPAGRRRP